jgi:hypothetical protein
MAKTLPIPRLHARFLFFPPYIPIQVLVIEYRAQRHVVDSKKVFLLDPCRIRTDDRQMSETVVLQQTIEVCYATTAPRDR